MPSKKYGEEVAAFIQVKNGSSISEDDIRSFCKENIAYYKIPRFIYFVDEFPTTASGKIQKFKLREIATHDMN